ncbi:MAG TPA: glycine zipper 2TM domain-containing protein [Rhodoferax sp.]
MNMTQTPNRIHPLLAVAAVSVTLASLVGIAAITDILPKSHSSTADGAGKTEAVATLSTPSVAAPANNANETIRNKSAVHSTAPIQVKQARQQSTTPSQQPVAQNSPIGIGVGAVVGGLLGNQVGGGNGKTLATIVGAVGGGYLGNEIAKKNP